MRKKLGGERGYLALEDVWIKSNFPRPNMPIREVGRSGERKNPRRRRKKRKKARTVRLGAGLKHYLGAINSGQARRQDLRRQARRQDLRRRAACQVTATSASSPRPRRQQRWHRANALFVWAGLAYKPWLKVLLAGLM